MSSRLCFAD